MRPLSSPRVAVYLLSASLAAWGCSPAKEPAAAAPAVDIAPAAAPAPSAEAGGAAAAEDAPGEAAPGKDDRGPAPTASAAGTGAAAIAPAPAPAPPGSQNAVKAQKLFDEAKRDMDGGNFAKACPKLEASLQLDFGLGTLMNLAQCFEKAGDRARACGLWGQAAAEAQAQGQAQRAQVAIGRRSQLGCGP